MGERGAGGDWVGKRPGGKRGRQDFKSWWQGDDDDDDVLIC